MDSLTEKALLVVKGALLTNPEAVEELDTLLTAFALKWRGWIITQRQDIPQVFKDWEHEPKRKTHWVKALIRRTK